MDGYFEDYYDEEGNIHIDARKPLKKGRVINYEVDIKDIVGIKPFEGKLIIHHVDISGVPREVL